MLQTDLSDYDNNNWYRPKSPVRRALWIIISLFFFQNSLPIPKSLKALILKIFGAKIGKKITIKPNVTIKYPWLLSIGNHSWIGENVWIDNLCGVKIGANACISQGAMLLTGSHDYTKTTFDLIVGEITIEDGVWIGAKAIVCPGITCESHSVLAVGSVATKKLEAFKVYQGNPAEIRRIRVIKKNNDSIQTL